MRSPSTITNSGFALADVGVHEDLALLSLDLAVRAYFDTADFADKHLMAPADPKQIYSNRYGELVFEAVVHLQHFFELLLKRILREEHELLAAEAPDVRHIATLRKLLKGQTVGEAEMLGMYSVEFATALQRLLVLLQTPPDGNSTLNAASKWSFLTAHKDFLEALNKIRNRMWHRGRFVLDYLAIDELVGGHAFALLAQLRPHLLLWTHSTREWWRPKPLACKLDPIDEIQMRYSSNSADARALAFLKALGKAGFNNPKLHGGLTLSEVQNAHDAELMKSHPGMVGLAAVMFDPDIIKSARAKAALRRDQRSIDELEAPRPCPACGEDFFYVFDDANVEFDENGDEYLGERYEYLAECMFCELQLYPSYGNPSEHGFANIPDIWAKQ